MPETKECAPPLSSRASGDDMIWLPGGAFTMGSNRHYPEEAPAHRVSVDPFWIDRYPVTNRQFREFVGATGYVTFAEIDPDPKDYPGALPHMLQAGSLVFTPPRRTVDLRDWSQWWRFEFGVNWRGRTVKAAPYAALMTTQLSTCHTRMPKPMRSGRARRCPQKPNGNTPHEVVLREPHLHGATSSCRAASRWRRLGMANFLITTQRRMGSSERRLSDHFRRMAMACST